jgi:UTP--glucose-1-phosphate uridylyltransferase
VGNLQIFRKQPDTDVDIKKAIITAAGKNQPTLPLQTLVDRDGTQKTALTIILEEVLKAGIEEICVVVRPGDQAAYRAASGAHAGRVQFIEQTKSLGYGHAVYSAAEFAGGQPFLHLVGDHLYVSRDLNNCAQQLVEVAQSEACAVSAVQATHESKLPFFGTVGGRLVAGRHRLYEVENVLEKPTPTEAEQKLIVPGLRAGRYLCFFGMHVLTPAVMDLLAELIAEAKGGVPLSDALSRLAGKERYLALELRGRRYDIGRRYGLLTAQLALAFEGKDRDEVLSNLVELLASKEE